MDIARQLCDFLSQKGSVVDYAQTGAQALQLVAEQTFDVILLDLTLPDCDGLTLCADIKETCDIQPPVLMLTARDSLDDKLQGFAAGTDDYLTKPFALEEVWMRCLSLSRRAELHHSKVIEIGALSLDVHGHKVTRQGVAINLSATEFTLLKLLADSYPNAVSKRQLTQKLWGEEVPSSDVLRSHIYTLRRAVDKPFDSAMIKTVHGIGFRLEASDDP